MSEALGPNEHLGAKTNDTGQLAEMEALRAAYAAKELMDASVAEGVNAGQKSELQTAAGVIAEAAAVNFDTESNRKAYATESAREKLRILTESNAPDEAKTSPEAGVAPIQAVEAKSVDQPAQNESRIADALGRLQELEATTAKFLDADRTTSQLQQLSTDLGKLRQRVAERDDVGQEAIRQISSSINRFQETRSSNEARLTHDMAGANNSQAEEQSRRVAEVARNFERTLGQFDSSDKDAGARLRSGIDNVLYGFPRSHPARRLLENIGTQAQEVVGRRNAKRRDLVRDAQIVITRAKVASA